MKLRFHLSCLALLAISLAARAGTAEVPTLDFRYAPRNWQTAICLPDDWQKSLVSKDGSLLYDYSGRGLDCDTVISVGLAGQTWTTQQLVSPKIPIVQTKLRSGNVEILEEAFAVAPPLTRVGQDSKPQIERQGADARMFGWAKPPMNTDPGFANIALGRGEPIRYRFRAKPGTSYTVGFGLCEGYHNKPGERVLDLQVEGRTVRTVDVIAEKGQNEPAVYLFPARDSDGDDWISLAVAASADSADKNAILNTLWVFQQQDGPAADELVGGRSKVKPLVHLDCSMSSLLQNPARHDVVTMKLRNTTAEPEKVSPFLTIKTEFPVKATAMSKEAMIGAATQLLLPEPIERVEQDGKITRLYFRERSLGPNSETMLAYGIVRGQQDPESPKLDLGSASKYRAKAEAYWKHLDFPYGHLTVPDGGVQALLDSSIRNIYQAREIKNGLPAFQVGPTRYRGLWVVDGSFLMEAVTFVGRDREARSGIEYLLEFQKPDGSFMLIDGHYKETGIVLWAVTRHARLTGDKEWLRSVWPKLERGFAYIRRMRDMPPADAPNARLIPAGYSDGGLSGKVPEYTNIYWTLAGVRAAIQAAHWLGLEAEAADWQKKYDDFFATFRRAAQRDMRSDGHGNQYLPIRMESSEPVSPQKAQWAFLHAVFPGKLFPAEDSLVQGNMRMLRAVEAEGLVRDTGWINDGLWTYFGSFYAHAWLWLGDGRKAASTLYAFGNHASPLLVWREEQMPVGEGDKVVGDMPHNWASAEFIRLVRHSLMLERGNELHLLEAMPQAWTMPGTVTSAKDILTEFGPVSLECRVSRDGKTASVRFTPSKRRQPARVCLHLDGWSGKSGVIDLAPDKPTVTKVELR